MTEPETETETSSEPQITGCGRKIVKALCLFGRSLSIVGLAWLLSLPVTDRLVQAVLIALVLGVLGEPFTTLFL